MFLRQQHAAFALWVAAARCVSSIPVQPLLHLPVTFSLALLVHQAWQAGLPMRSVISASGSRQCMPLGEVQGQLVAHIGTDCDVPEFKVDILWDLVTLGAG